MLQGGRAHIFQRTAIKFPQRALSNHLNEKNSPKSQKKMKSSIKIGTKEDQK